MAKYDLYNLPDDVLFLSKQSFSDFVEQVCGPVEASLLQIQGIQNSRSLIRCSNLSSILDIDCEEVEKLKPSICFVSKTGECFVRQGVQLNLNNLSDTLKEKQEKYKKKNIKLKYRLLSQHLKQQIQMMKTIYLNEIFRRQQQMLYQT